MIHPDSISRLLNDIGDLHPEAEEYPAGFFNADPKPASVLMPLFRERGDWHMLFIRRSEHENDRHSGQVAFPGGKVDTTDRSPVAAALREAHEEIGLAPENVRVLGCMKEYRTISNYLVSPVVSEIRWPLSLTPDSREVSRIFSIPMRWLADPDNYVTSRRILKEFDARLQVIHYRRFDGELLWGITARLTLSLIDILRTEQNP
jgi:8-oxo-dGTP pyrophosphatase MutT (NUDIX family)